MLRNSLGIGWHVDHVDNLTSVMSRRARASTGQGAWHARSSRDRSRTDRAASGGGEIPLRKRDTAGWYGRQRQRLVSAALPRERKLVPDLEVIAECIDERADVLLIVLPTSRGRGVHLLIDLVIANGGGNSL